MARWLPVIDHTVIDPEPALYKFKVKESKEYKNKSMQSEPLSGNKLFSPLKFTSYQKGNLLPEQRLRY